MWRITVCTLHIHVFILLLLLLWTLFKLMLQYQQTSIQETCKPSGKKTT